MQGIRGFAVFVACLGGCGDDGPSEIASLSSAEATAYVLDAPVRIRVESSDGLALEQHGTFAFSTAGGVDEVASVEVDDSQADSLSLTLTTTSGAVASAELRFTGPRSLRVAVDAPDGVDLVSVAYRLETDERIYGLTERLRDSAILNPDENGPMIDDLAPTPDGTLDRRGDVVDMFVHPTFSLYAPLAHSSRGYGIWIENTTPGTFDVAAADAEQLAFQFETGAAQASQTFTQHLLLGPRHHDVLKQYYELAGFPFRPPDWAFLHWRWRGELTSGPTADLDGMSVNAEIAEDVAMYETHGIPFGVYLFDRPYLVGSEDPDSEGFSEFVWDPTRLPNIAHTLAALESRGMHIVVWASSWARGTAAGTNGADAAALGYHAPGSDRVIDFTNPDAVDWWVQRFAEFASDWGIDGVKLDRGEEFIPNAVSDLWFDGRTGRELHNEFQIMQSRVYHDAMDAATAGDFLVLARSGYSGSQQWAIQWGGDAFGSDPLGLRAAIIMQQRAGFLGFPFWGSDTGGYYEFTDREVFARWLQFSAFSPIMEIGGIGTHAPWDMPTDPAVDDEMIEIYRRYVQAHHDLVPYLLEQADAVSQTGMPIARAMVFDFPDDPDMLDRWDQYMVGPDLLVAPVWRPGERSRDVVLPAGDWEWLWDRGRSYTGPSTVTVDAPLEVIPVFVRAGADVGI